MEGSIELFTRLECLLLLLSKRKPSGRCVLGRRHSSRAAGNLWLRFSPVMLWPILWSLRIGWAIGWTSISLVFVIFRWPFFRCRTAPLSFQAGLLALACSGASNG